MKFPSVYDLAMRRLAGVKRSPLRTIKELADEFGVSSRSLAKRMYADPDGPRRIFRHHSGGGSSDYRTKSVSWYNPVEVRRWWRAHSVK